jgi:hypothetical protein
MAFWLVLHSMLRPPSPVSNASPSSSTVVMYSTPRTAGSLPSPASCTLPPWVRIYVLLTLAATLWLNVTHTAMGIMILVSSAGGWAFRADAPIDFSIPYGSVSVALNILLTLMIVIRLILHGRKVRAAMGAPAGISGLYKTVVTLLIESSALYAVNTLLLIGLWVADSGAADIFLPILCETQVRGFS